MTGRRLNGGGARWMQSPWRWRGIDGDGQPGKWLHADTLADCRTDFIDSDYGSAEIDRYDRHAAHYGHYGTLLRIGVRSRLDRQP